MPSLPLDRLSESIARNQEALERLCRIGDRAAPVHQTIEGWKRNIEAAKKERQMLLEACHGVDILYAEMQAALPLIAGTKGFDLVTDAVRKARVAIAKATNQ
jgi:hypothetical protein